MLLGKRYETNRRHAPRAAFAFPLTSEGVKEEQESGESRGSVHGSHCRLLSVAGLYVR